MELLPDYAPKTFWKYVLLTYYVDANIFHVKLAGNFVTGTIHMAKKSVDYYYKKYTNVYMTTYGTEFFWPYLCGEYYFWYIILYLGVPIFIKATIFDTSNMLLAVPSTTMLSYIIVALRYPSIYSRRLLHIIWLPSNMSLEETNHPNNIK